jgi:hypothetical protein
VMDRLRQADPRLAQVDRDAVVPGVFMRSGNKSLPPEAVAAAALQYQAPKVRITPEALAKAAGITPAQAEAALQSADRVLNPPWSQEAAAARVARGADVGRMARALADTNAQPVGPRPPQPDTLTRPQTERVRPEETLTRPQTERLVQPKTKTDVAQRSVPRAAVEEPGVANPKPVVEEFDPTADPDRPVLEESDPTADPGRPVVKEFDPTADTDSGRGFDMQEWQRQFDANNAARRQQVAAARTPENPDARKFGQFSDSPSLDPGVRINRPMRKLTPGDREYLASVMGDVPMRGPNGTVQLKAGQQSIGVDPVNDYVVDILNAARRGEPFPLSRENPLIQIQIDPKTGIVGEGHHRLVAAQIVSRMTGRPLYGSDNAVIPKEAISWQPVARSESPWADVHPQGLRVNTAGPAVTSRQTQLEQLNAAQRTNPTPEAQRQIDQLNWELQRMNAEWAHIQRELAADMRRFAEANPDQHGHLRHQADTVDVAAMRPPSP